MVDKIEVKRKKIYWNGFNSFLEWLNCFVGFFSLFFFNFFFFKIRFFFPFHNPFFLFNSCSCFSFSFSCAALLLWFVTTHKHCAKLWSVCVKEIVMGSLVHVVLLIQMVIQSLLKTLSVLFPVYICMRTVKILDFCLFLSIFS